MSPCAVAAYTARGRKLPAVDCSKQHVAAPELQEALTPRRPRSPQKASEDLAGLLRAQEGDAFTKQISALTSCFDEFPLAGRDPDDPKVHRSPHPLSVAVTHSCAPHVAPRTPRSREPRAKHPRDTPRLGKDFKLLRSALAQPPSPGRSAKTHEGQADTGRKSPSYSTDSWRKQKPPPSNTRRPSGLVGTRWKDRAPDWESGGRSPKRPVAAESPAKEKVQEEAGAPPQRHSGRYQLPSKARQMEEKARQKEAVAGLGGLYKQSKEDEFFEERRGDRVGLLASQLRIPLDILRQAYEVFEKFCTAPEKPSDKPGSNRKKEDQAASDSFDVIKDGLLNQEGFAKVLCKLSGCKDITELRDGLLERGFRDADSDSNHGITFLEFALWYSRHGFTENVLLTKAQREIRALARKYDIPIIEVEHYKTKFDVYDEDGSGQIDFEEFEKLLSSLVKVPGQLDLPKSRVKQFWAEADPDGNGAVCFEEFVIFYSRYFSINNPAHCAFKEYYRGIRRVCVAPGTDDSHGDEDH